jgi:hypothetical protein
MTLNLTKHGKQEMYRAIKERFNLKAAQRDRLDKNQHLEGVLKLAYLERWQVVETILRSQGIID